MPASLLWTSLFAAALVASLALRTWLAARQVRHVARHRDEVPGPFRGRVPLEAHRKAAAYTLARLRLGQWQMIFGALVLLGWTLFGGLDAINAALREAVAPAWGGLAYQLALVAAFVLIGSLLELPFDLYATFRLEQRFGFNRTTWPLWLADAPRVSCSASSSACRSWPSCSGSWPPPGRCGGCGRGAAWMSIIVAAQVLVPTLIAPLFNRFVELADPALKERIHALMTRAGLAASGLFVMDGSRRSAHANAYFTGFGRAKRVVFFDTLLARLAPAEVEAVLAHELGHWKLRHIAKRMMVMAVATLAFFVLLGWLATRAWFYTGLGVAPNLGAPNDALALLLVLLALPPFTVFATPLATRWSRRDEFEADAYASAQASGADLASALLKLHEDNAATLTPDPLYARFYYSHPPAVERLAALASMRPGSATAP